MIASQPTRRRVAAVWRTAHRAVAALRAIHDEQVLMWELFWQSSHVVDRAGSLAWQAKPGRAPADRQRPAHPQGRQLMQHAMTGTARPGPRADAEAMAPPSGRWLGPE
jgi:hypothetical protein